MTEHFHFDVPAAGAYRIDPTSSSIAFTGRHFFGLGTVAGSFALSAGEVTIADALLSSKVTAVTLASSFSTGTSGRDKAVQSARFLNATQHPEIGFRSTALRDDGSCWVLCGDLIAAGTSAPCEFTIVSMTADESSFTAEATATIDRYAHGINKMKGMAGRFVDLAITAHAIRA
ncbi:unannotated protein [freshwater metagenome]|uniref:Unannotated protein n=1 Tax=freshwater metagenome TaxID=449393 RepID=A0A6J7F296_9ZZZZ|nr:YceI family protein [Actinomycetota bacterium]